MWHFIAIFSLGLVIPVSVNADIDAGYRTIESIGCHSFNKICWVGVSGSAAGPSACTTTSFRWDGNIQSNSDQLLSILLSAYTVGKEVRFVLEDNCLSSQTAYPVIRYVYTKPL